MSKSVRKKESLNPDDFLPMSRAAMTARGWDELDVLFISGDAYIDHPAFGVPLLARLLESKGWRVGILAQPDWRDPQSLQVMGRPRLCVAISAGAMDSMVNHYTAARKLRRDDAYTPGGKAGARPNRAIIAYTAAAKGAFKGLPVLIGGIEASLRQLAHYDYWSDQVRRSILVDSKADLLLYGMAETALLQVVEALARGADIASLQEIAGTAWLSRTPVDGELLPAFAEVSGDTSRYAEAFARQLRSGNKRLVQNQGDRFVVVNPPAAPLTTAQLDALYALPFQRRPHPDYVETIPAFDQIRWSMTSHRGCQGGCAFCAITRHQGRRIQSRSLNSLLDEARRLVADPAFRGTISDVGGPTANMYGTRVRDEQRCGSCQRESCLYPQFCPNLELGDAAAVRMLRQLRQLEGVKNLFVASGVRFDLLGVQPHYEKELFDCHVGGLLKVAPESLSEPLLRHMRKPSPQLFARFVERFRTHQQRKGTRMGLVPYLIAGHPGCTLDDMVETALFLKRHHLRVEQVQEFTPTPGTLATCMYYTGLDPVSGKAVAVERSERKRRLHKALLLYHQPEQRGLIREALRACGREQDAEQLFGSAPGTSANRASVSRSGPRSRRRH
ncbi:MAG: YgiQ family radical SAM protein [Desulfuromonadaceae bacterium]|nr:YgiQ family radical SAM protein [Desulfuromonadaceae bacterium]